MRKNPFDFPPLLASFTSSFAVIRVRISWLCFVLGRLQKLCFLFLRRLWLFLRSRFSLCNYRFFERSLRCSKSAQKMSLQRWRDGCALELTEQPIKNYEHQASNQNLEAILHRLIFSLRAESSRFHFTYTVEMICAGFTGLPFPPPSFEASNFFSFQFWKCSFLFALGMMMVILSRLHQTRTFAS